MLGAGLVHLLAGDAAVAVEVEPLEQAVGAALAALGAHRLRVLAGEAAVIIGVEPVEPPVGMLDGLLAGDVGVAVGPRARPGLGGGDAGEASRAAPESRMIFFMGNSSIGNVIGPSPGPCRLNMSAAEKIVPFVARRDEAGVRRG